jgi:hypothetical protein
MPDWLVAFLLLVFVVHLVVFGRLALKRRMIYYWLLTAVFAALVAAFGIRLFEPGWAVGGEPVYQWARYVAWGLAAITIPWTVARIVGRRRQRQQAES